MEQVSRTYLQPKLPRVWNTVATTRLVPGLHVAHLDYELASMVVAAMLGLKFDVAEHTYKQMQERFRKTSRYPLPFRGLVTPLCKRADVEFNESPTHLQAPTTDPLRESRFSKFHAPLSTALPTPPEPVHLVHGHPLPVYTSQFSAAEGVGVEEIEEAGEEAAEEPSGSRQRRTRMEKLLRCISAMEVTQKGLVSQLDTMMGIQQQMWTS